MTWAIHTIGFLDIHDTDEAAKVFEKSYSLYTRQPFKVWSESMPGIAGTGNFITGAGGFLQSVINGYGGVRLHFGSLTISNFYVPPQSSSLEFNGITYLNNRFSLRIGLDEATVTFKELDRDHPIVVILKPSNIEITPTVGSEVKLTRTDELVMEARKSPFDDCQMKETVLGQRAGGVALTINMLLIAALGIFAVKF